ncbi:hypothetical protein B0H14DRAFT_2605675 [Mycena olivaceomarginata]|nr:hypothetical protein B0H14DRAFT_2605675 [Mycena olivaceomarginata]
MAGGMCAAQGAYYNGTRAWQGKGRILMCTAGAARAHYNGSTGDATSAVGHGSLRQRRGRPPSHAVGYSGQDEVWEGLHIGAARDGGQVTCWGGTRMLTQGQGILRQINLWIHKAKLCYHSTRNVLVQLQGHGPWEKELRVLEDMDVHTLSRRRRR